jgi:phosphopantothenoylcysteine synthetase/decarboxylase
MFGCSEVNYHQTHSARDWLSILRTTYTTQNLQRKRRTDKMVCCGYITLNTLHEVDEENDDDGGGGDDDDDDDDYDDDDDNDDGDDDNKAYMN